MKRIPKKKSARIRPKVSVLVLYTVDFMLSPPPLDFFLAKKGRGGGLSTYFLTLAKFGLKDLAWDIMDDIFWEKNPIQGL